MKKYLILALIALWSCAGARLVAQNCEHIVLSHYGYNENIFDVLPEGKFVWFCTYSHNALVPVDALPSGVTARSISVVSNRYTGEALPSSFVVNPETISLFDYTFEDFQLPEDNVYFATPGSAHPYLMLRSSSETHQLTQQQVDIYSYGDITHSEAISNETR